MGKIKIAISGAHSTGKTTFIEKLSSELLRQNIKYKVITDLAIGCPLPILRDQTVESTLWIACNGIMKEIEASHLFDVTIVDRSILDCWAYFNNVCKDRYEENNPKLLTLKNTIGNWLPTYDILYQTVIDKDFPIENAKGRDLDITFREAVGLEFIKANDLFKSNPKLLCSHNSDDVFRDVLNAVITNISPK